MGREDRINFGGIYREGVRTDITGLTLRLRGYDHAKHELVETGGALSLMNDDGVVAAEWSFTALATLWNRKHAQAVYVPAECRLDPAREYRYGNKVRLGEGTDFLKLLAAIADGIVYYDPAVKLEGASGPKPAQKRRSQFRIKSGALPALYETMSEVDVHEIQ